MRLFKHPLIRLTALAVLALGSAAQAQAPRGPPCIERGQAIAHLQAMFAERAIGRGLADGGFVFELFVSPSGSWTVFATTPQGQSCYIASGQAWEPVPTPDLHAGR